VFDGRLRSIYTSILMVLSQIREWPEVPTGPCRKSNQLRLRASQHCVIFLAGDFHPELEYKLYDKLLIGFFTLLQDSKDSSQ
jgi:hypothetical protein